MTDGVEPLGPAWTQPLSAAEAAARVCAALPQRALLPEPVRLGNCLLYILTALGRELVSPNRASGFRSVCAIGAFDGVHVGHRALVACAIADARSHGVPAVAVTFDPDPSRVLAGAARGCDLLSHADRLAMLAGLGVDALLVIRFDEVLADLSYDEFLSGMLLPALSPASIHVGADFRMGRGGEGNVASMRSYCSGFGVEVVGHELVGEGGEAVCATRVRRLLGEGDVRGASALLGRDHLVRGRVVHGRGEGTSFGFPTANVVVPEAACLPAEGVYGGYVVVGSHAWPAAVNVGAPRSFEVAETRPFLEATLVGFSGDLYGLDVTVTFVERLRAQRRFFSLGELERVVLGNVAWVRRNLGDQAVDIGRERVS